LKKDNCNSKGKKCIISFEQNWFRVWTDGWKISQGAFIPPKDHEADEWSGEWYPNKDNIYIYPIGLPDFIL